MWEPGTDQKRFEILLFFEMAFVWSLAFVPLFYLTFDYILRVDDRDLFGTYINKSVMNEIEEREKKEKSNGKGWVEEGDGGGYDDLLEIDYLRSHS